MCISSARVCFAHLVPLKADKGHRGISCRPAANSKRDSFYAGRACSATPIGKCTSSAKQLELRNLQVISNDICNGIAVYVDSDNSYAHHGRFGKPLIRFRGISKSGRTPANDQFCSLKGPKQQANIRHAVPKPTERGTSRPKTRGIPPSPAQWPIFAELNVPKLKPRANASAYFVLP